MLALLGLAPLVPLLVCLWALAYRPSGGGAPGLGLRAARQVGWLGLWAVPASRVQSLRFLASFDATDTSSWAEILGVHCFSWWVLLGGASVQGVFEDTAKELTGHRQSTMIDNWPYYVTLTYVQTAAIALLLAAFPSGAEPEWRQRRSWIAGVLVGANAFAGIAWPWWGS